MEIGGTRRSLLNLLGELAKRNDAECSLLIFAPFGDYMSQLPPKVKIVKSNKALAAMFSSVRKLLDRRDYIGLSLKALLSVKKKFVGEHAVMNELYKQHIKNTTERYDIAIGFQEGGCNDYASLTHADKKVFWIHNNYENLTELAHGDPLSYERADSINFVAEASMNSFKTAMPEFASKMRVIKNVLPQDQIKAASLERCEQIYGTNSIHLISVGRIARQKGFDRIIEVANELKNKGLDFEWIILGDGEQRESLVTRCKEQKLENNVKFIGAVSNPYPLMRQANLFVLTSRYESQPMVIMEALTLGLPVLSTSFDSVNEIIQGKAFALAVENSTKGISDGLQSLLEDKGRIEEMKNATSEFVYDNSTIVNQILEL